MSKTNNLIFKGLLIVAWIIFVGLCVETGGLMVNFVFSLYEPEVVQNLYQKLDLSEMYRESRMTFYSIYSFILVIAILKAYLFYIVVRLMHKLDLSEPFSSFVSRRIAEISYFTLSIGLLSYLAGETAEGLLQQGLLTENLTHFWEGSRAFILMGAVIYIIATIFKKGVELQTENELTV